MLRDLDQAPGLELLLRLLVDPLALFTCTEALPVRVVDLVSVEQKAVGPYLVHIALELVKSSVPALLEFLPDGPEVHRVPDLGEVARNVDFADGLQEPGDD